MEERRLVAADIGAVILNQLTMELENVHTSKPP
jgi:hypothetical protein